MTTLTEEGRRQLDICNACRYCEGYCAVYPALERRVLLDPGDLLQLANLCHDCRACYYACMYAPPHEFALNPPQLFSALRQESYRELEPLPFLGRAGRAIVVGAVIATVLIVIGVTRGLGALVASHPHAASPYTVLPYPAILAIGLATAAFAVLVIADGGRRYLAAIGPRPEASSPTRAFARAMHEAGTLKYLRSAGVECTYPTSTESPERRLAHQVLVLGVFAALASTIAAGIAQDLLSSPPPYGIVSAPVLLGLVGGALMIAGGAGLARLNHMADPAPADPPAQRGDRAFLGALLVLAVTGVASTLTRWSAAYGVLLTVHLVAVFSCFALAPFTKFVHFVYRFLALVRDNEEREVEFAGR